MDDELKLVLAELDEFEPPTDLWEGVRRRRVAPGRRLSRGWIAAGAVAVICLVIAVIGVTATRGHESAPTLAVATPSHLVPGSINYDASLPAPPRPLVTLNGVSASSPTSAWIVGRRPTPKGSVPLAWRWTGQTWVNVPVDSPDQRSDFQAVTTLSPTDAWAVGIKGDNTSDEYGSPLAMHWDGRRWNAVETGVASGILFGVGATGRADVWAVGGTGGVGHSPLALHWNGTRWNRVQLPAFTGDVGALTNVEAVSPSDVWITNSPAGGGTRSVILHWDGHRMERMPDPFGASDPPAAIAASSASDVWAVGSASDRPACANAHVLPLAAHWDGSSWTREDPELIGTDTDPSSVSTAQSGGSGWLAGSTATLHYYPDRCHTGNGGFGIQGSLPGLMVQHLADGRWSKVEVPRRELFTGLAEVAPDRAGGAWIIASDDWSATVARLVGGRWVSVRHPSAVASTS